MTIKIIPVNENNVIKWRKSVRRVFGDIPSKSDIERMLAGRFAKNTSWEKRLIAALDDETNKIVGTGGADEFKITAPGGKNLNMAGIAYMGTAPTHKRRGIFTSMMNKLHEQAKERGDVLAGLWASQSVLYSRFGYGLGTLREDWSIETHSTKLIQENETNIQLEFVEKEIAKKELFKIYDEFRKKQNGSTDRTEEYWNYILYENENSKYNKSGMSGLFFVVAYKNKQPSGYAFYNFNKESGIAHEDDKGELIVHELIAVDKETNISLWNFIFGIELVEKVTINRRAPHDPLYFLLENPRQLERMTIDGLWVRILDPIKFLEARKYNHEGRINLEITGQNQSDIEGVYEIDTNGETSIVKKVNSSPDISMRPSDLSSCFFGAITPFELVNSRNINAKNFDKLNLFSNMFNVLQKPWCNTDF